MAEIKQKMSLKKQNQIKKALNILISLVFEANTSSYRHNQAEDLEYDERDRQSDENRHV